MTISARECHWSVQVKVMILLSMHTFAMDISRMAIFSISTGDGEETLTATSLSHAMIEDGMMNVYIIEDRQPFSILSHQRHLM